MEGSRDTVFLTILLMTIMYNKWLTAFKQKCTTENLIQLQLYTDYTRKLKKMKISKKDTHDSVEIKSSGSLLKVIIKWTLCRTDISSCDSCVVVHRSHLNTAIFLHLDFLSVIVQWQTLVRGKSSLLLQTVTFVAC